MANKFLLRFKSSILASSHIVYYTKSKQCIIFILSLTQLFKFPSILIYLNEIRFLCFFVDPEFIDSRLDDKFNENMKILRELPSPRAHPCVGWLKLTSQLKHETITSALGPGPPWNSGSQPSRVWQTLGLSDSFPIVGIIVDGGRTGSRDEKGRQGLYENLM